MKSNKSKKRRLTMAEYTYKDIIIDPNSEEAKNAVGKICYFSNSPRNILSDIYRKSAVEGILTNMDDGYFEVDNEGYWDCIILKKEEPKPEYVPFESKEEFIEAYHYHDNAKYSETEDILLNYGMWLWSNEDGSYKLVTEIWNAGVVIGDDKMRITNEEGHIDVFNDTTSWVKLFSEYRFLDGSHCGKEVKDE